MRWLRKAGENAVYLRAMGIKLAYVYTWEDMTTFQVSGIRIVVRDSMPRFSSSISTFAYNLSVCAYIVMQIHIFHLLFKNHHSHTSHKNGKPLSTSNLL